MKKSVQNKLESTQRKVSKIWVSYRKEKTKILSNKRLSQFEKRGVLEDKRANIYLKVSESFRDYREAKSGILYKSPYEDFKYSKGEKTINTVQKYYKAKRNYDTSELDRVIPKILDESGVIGVLVVFQVESEETGEKQYVSNYITKDLYERLQQNDEKVFNYIAERLRVGNTKDYHLKFIYIRVIYAKSKSIKSKN